MKGTLRIYDYCADINYEPVHKEELEVRVPMTYHDGRIEIGFQLKDQLYYVEVHIGDLVKEAVTTSEVLKK